MPAIVTDQFRILNASNFVENVTNGSNSYYVFIGLANPKTPTENTKLFGRDWNWNSSGQTPAPIDNFSNNYHVGDTILYGKKITADNIRRVIRKVSWEPNTRYDFYRDDVSYENKSKNTNVSNLYSSNYYVINQEFKVYVCISNGATGSNPQGNISADQPNFTDLEPSKAGGSGDGYLWKYLFTVSPADIIKFDSTEYITVPNNWATTVDPSIRSVRENADSTVNSNQLKHVYIDNAGVGYGNFTGKECDILGDGSGAKARVDATSGKITNVVVSAGGKGYSYGIVDLGTSNTSSIQTLAKLVPLIPPSRGHGFDIYTELGTDKVLIYARFDDATKDFPVDAKFAQVGILKNPTKSESTEIFSEGQFSGLPAIKMDDSDSLSLPSGSLSVGEKITQLRGDGKTAEAYVASYDIDTHVIKYFRDRSLNYSTAQDQTDYSGVANKGTFYDFESTKANNTPANNIVGENGYSGQVYSSFTGITTASKDGTKVINLGTTFNEGLSKSEINKGSGDLVYVDNRPLIARNPRQKEDVKIILEF